MNWRCFFLGHKNELVALDNSNTTKFEEYGYSNVVRHNLRFYRCKECGEKSMKYDGSGASTHPRILLQMTLWAEAGKLLSSSVEIKDETGS